MTTGLVILAFGRLPALLWMSNATYTLFKALFTTFEDLPQAGWPEYLAMAGTVATLETTALVTAKLIKRKSIPHTYDVESMRRKVNEAQNPLQNT